MFGPSKVITVGSATMHIMDVHNLGNPAGEAVVEAVLSSGVPVASMRDITAGLIGSNLTGFSLKVDRAYDYARDHYKLGLPSGARMALPLIQSSEILPYLKSEIAYPHDVVITDHEYAKYTAVIAIAAFLKNVRGYTPYSDIVTNWPPGTVFTSHWGEDTTKFPRRVQLESAYILPDNVTARVTYRKYVQRSRVTYQFVEIGQPAKKVIVYEWINDGVVLEDVPVPGATADTLWGGDCLFVLYNEVTAEGQILPTYHSWVYQLNDYRYPELHPDVTQDLSTFLPVIPLRYNNQDLTVPSNTDLYKTSNKLMTLLGSNFGALGAKLNANPSIRDIDHAYVLFGVNVQTDYVPSLYYLNHHFYYLYQNQRGTESDFLAALENPALNDEPSNVFAYNIIARLNNESPAMLSEYGLALDVVFDYIKVRTENKVIGKVEHADKKIEAYQVTVTQTMNIMGTEQVFTHEQTRHKLVLRAQINKYQIRVVEVYNLRTINWVYKHGNIVSTSLADIASDPDENGLFIPVQYQLSKLVFNDIKTRNAFYADSMLLVINSIEKTKLKWYQRGWFKIIIMVVALVVAAWTGQWYIAKIAAAYAAGGVVAVMLLVGQSVLFSLALSYAVNYVVRHYGEKIGIIGAIILTIAAMIASKGFGAFGTASQFMMTTTQYMLQISTALISSANEFLLEKAEGIKDNFIAFTEKMDGLWKDLEEITDLLAWKADLDPLLFTKPERLKILPNESPTVFFNRCLGLVDNTMFTVHDEIPNFFDMRLRHTKDVSPNLYGLNSYA